MAELTPEINFLDNFALVKPFITHIARKSSDLESILENNFKRPTQTRFGWHHSKDINKFLPKWYSTDQESRPIVVPWQTSDIKNEILDLIAHVDMGSGPQFPLKALMPCASFIQPLCRAFMHLEEADLLETVGKGLVKESGPIPQK